MLGASCPGRGSHMGPIMPKLAGIVLSLSLVAGCAPASQGQVQVARPATPAAPCHAGADARGIAAGFFSFFTDDLNGCL